MFKILTGIAIGILVIDLIVSLILGHIDNYYNPSIKATYSGFVASVLGIVFGILLLTYRKFNLSSRVLIPVAVILGIVSVLAIIFEFALGFYLGAWACLVWLVLVVIFVYAIKSEKTDSAKMKQLDSVNVIPLNQKGNSPASEDINQSNHPSQAHLMGGQKKCCNSSCCQLCCHSCCSITTLLLMCLFTAIAITYYSNWNQYPVYGKLIQITDAQNNYKYSVHGYCIGQEHATRPTIILQHGGGSNSMAFYDLGNVLTGLGWKMCAYDRLGYGRSSVIPRYMTIEKRAELTNGVITKLLESHTNKNVIFGGWSAGVELSLIYANLYPTNVQGLIFMDGYPDYLTLMGIYDNKTSAIKVNTLGVTGIVRVLEPFGLGLIVGSNQMASDFGKQYYRAYYQTGYFWESQYLDVANPYPTTQWLTTAAGSATKPYPSSSIPLNWPDITVPLLVMPANGTVTNGQYAQMYLNQAQKYLDKCTNGNKQLTVVEGDHGFVLKSPTVVSANIHNFFSPLF